APNPISDRPGAEPLHRPAGRVAFDHVGFTYPAAADTTLASLADGVALGRVEATVLHDVSFVAEPGQLVALVGPSGAGKSTIASLVPRLYDVTSGAITLDGRDIRDITLDSLRESIGVVSQDPHLFHDTIANNLRYARPGATQAELEEAA